jgi:hypothetical protein
MARKIKGSAENTGIRSEIKARILFVALGKNKKSGIRTKAVVTLDKKAETRRIATNTEKKNFSFRLFVTFTW